MGIPLRQLVRMGEPSPLLNLRPMCPKLAKKHCAFVITVDDIEKVDKVRTKKRFWIGGDSSLELLKLCWGEVGLVRTIHP